jgi:hypothetical protein
MPKTNVGYIIECAAIVPRFFNDGGPIVVTRRSRQRRATKRRRSSRDRHYLLTSRNFTIPAARLADAAALGLADRRRTPTRLSSTRASAPKAIVEKSGGRSFRLW